MVAMSEVECGIDASWQAQGGNRLHGGIGAFEAPGWRCAASPVLSARQHQQSCLRYSSQLAGSARSSCSIERRPPPGRALAARAAGSLLTYDLLILSAPRFRGPRGFARLKLFLKIASLTSSGRHQTIAWLHG